MRKFHDSGVEINEEVRNLLEKGVFREGNQTKFAAKVNVGNNSVKQWRGHTGDSRARIAWEVWPKLRSYFLENGDIEADDPKFMSPNDMRLFIETMRQSGSNLADKSITGDEAELLKAFRLLAEDKKKAVLLQLKNGGANLAAQTSNFVQMECNGNTITSNVNSTDNNSILMRVFESLASVKMCDACRGAVCRIIFMLKR